MWSCIAVPSRSGGFYLQGRGFSSVYSAASAVRFFHRVDARWLSSRFRFPFLFHRLFFVCTFVVVELANSINASPPVNTWSGPYCELYCHAVCTWKLWNLPLSWFVYERIRLNLKIERGLHVKMLDSMLFNKILRNHLLSENMLWNYASFNVSLTYLMHEIMDFCMTSSLALDNWEQKYCQTTGNTAKPFTPCPARTIIFQRKNLNYLIVCFARCTLFFQKVCFVLPICLPCVICGSYITKMNAVLWHNARHSRRLACLHSHVLRAYCNFESKQANSITLFGRRPNNNPFMDFSTEAKYSQLSPCGHLAITDNPRIRTAGKSQAKIN